MSKTYTCTVLRRFLSFDARSKVYVSQICRKAPVLQTIVKHNTKNFSSANATHAVQLPFYLTASDNETEQILGENMKVYDNFLSEKEEESLLLEIEPQIKRIRYQDTHWDDAIHGYREIERKVWNSVNQEILKRVREISFEPGTPQIDFTHILDIKKEGYIKPHIDAVRFCGRTIAGLCLLSPCVMRLVLDKNKEKYGDILLNRRALYVMKDKARYEYTHEVLSAEKSYFKGKVVPRDRRVSVICRNEPK